MPFDCRTDMIYKECKMMYKVKKSWGAAEAVVGSSGVNGLMVSARQWPTRPSHLSSSDGVQILIFAIVIITILIILIFAIVIIANIIIILIFAIVIITIMPKYGIKMRASLQIHLNLIQNWMHACSNVRMNQINQRGCKRSTCLLGNEEVISLKTESNPSGDGSNAHMNDINELH